MAESRLAGIAAMITAIVAILTFYYSLYLPSQKHQPVIQPPAIQPLAIQKAVPISTARLVGDGNGLLGQDKYAQAIQYYDKALSIDPNDKDALTGKGSALGGQGNYAQAIQYFDKALSIDPNYRWALASKGIILGGQGNYAQAIQYFDKLLSIDPNDKFALNEKQQALSRLSR